MKLISGSGKKRPRNNVAGTKQGQKSNAAKVSKPAVSNKSVTSTKQKTSSKKKIAIFICILISIIFLFTISAVATVVWEIQPFYDIFFPRPEIPRDNEFADSDNDVYNASGINRPSGPIDINNPEFSGIPTHEIRSEHKLTILILGIDGYKGMRTEGGGNTDVIMIASFDMEDSTLDIVSIPRDTIVNVPWNVKKVNSIWAAMAKSYNSESDSAKRASLTMEDTKKHFAGLLGFNIDYWVTIDMAGFEQLVDAIGGVSVNVPRSFELVDEEIGLNVTLSQGTQTLNGMQALALARYRGSAGGDFDRVDSQHIIMKAMAVQLLSKESIRNNPIDMFNVITKYVRTDFTDLDSNELIRVLREGVNVTGDNINFYTAPVKPYTVRGTGAGWYTAIVLDEWVKLVNEKLNPYKIEITPDHMSVLTLDENNKFYVTDGNWQGSQNWGR